MSFWFVRVERHFHDAAFSAQWHTDAGTASTSDYVHQNTHFISSTAAEQQNNRAKRTFATREDDLIEGNETFTIRFSPVDNVVNQDNPDRDEKCEITIIDDDPWLATMTPVVSGSTIGYSHPGQVGTLSDRTFSWAGTDYAVDEVFTDEVFSQQVGAIHNLHFTLNNRIRTAALSDLTLVVGTDEFVLANGTISPSRKSVSWHDSGLSWSVGTDVSLSFKAIIGRPELTSSQVGFNGNQIGLIFNENLGSPSPPKSAFSITADGSPISIGNITRGNSGLLNLLSLSPVIGQGQTVKLEYTDPTTGDDSNAIQDTDGVDAHSFTVTVANQSTVTLPALTAASVPADGGTVALTFSRDLDFSGTFTATIRDAFSVTVDGTANAVTGVSGSGDTATLTMADTIEGGRTVVVGYDRSDAGSEALGTSSTKLVADFTTGENSVPAVTNRAYLNLPTNPTARAVAPTRVTLRWDRTMPSPKGLDHRDFPGYRIEWSADGNDPWTSLVNYTNQHGTFDIWCTCYPTRFNDDTIAPGTTRYYRIKAVNGDAESLWSDVVSATTPGLVDSDGGQIAFGAVVSELDALNDQKVFRIDLESGEYRFMIAGKAPKHRVIVTDAGGTEIENFVLVANNTLIPRITAQSSGQHQVKISHGGGFGNAGGGGLNAGWFHFQLVPVSDPAVGTLRLPDTPNLPAVLSTYGDVDRAELAVQPGKAYAVRVRGRETADGTAATPRIIRARPPSTTHEYNMGKPWVDGVTIAKASPLCHNFSEPEKCEFQAFVIDLRGLTGAEQTWWINVAPTARPRTYPYHVGTYEVDLRELSSSDLRGMRMPLRAWFASQPAQHDGSNRIKVRVAFSDAVDESPENVGEHSVSVDGGEVTSVRPVDGQATSGSKARKGARSAGGQEDEPEDREVVWEFEIDPDSNRDVTVSLEAWRPCDEPGAICTADGRALSRGISTTVPSSLPLTASFQEVPEAHDGESTFTFRTAFSDNIAISFRALREDAFTVTGGTVTGGRRVDDRRDLFEITVQPDSRDEVTITLPAGRDCGVSGAVCTKGENQRQLTNSPSATVAGPPNTASEGAPTISGTPQVGEELTASTSGISDRDGLENVSFTHQWLADDTAIQGATNSSYILTEADEGKAIKVSVSFTDDAGNRETLTSAATDAVTAAAQSNSPAMGPPVITGTAQVGETLTVDTSGIADEDGLTNGTFSYQWLADDAEIAGATGSTYTLVDDDEGKAIAVEVTFTDDLGNEETLTSAATDAVAAQPTPNSPATGAPTISGIAQVGETLTANTSGVADADGLSNVQYEYQWLADEADISGATNAAYTLADTDEGKAIKVEVSFTDDAGNEETLTSGATEAVEARPNSPATGAPSISGAAQVGETLTADISGIADEDGLDNASFSYQWTAGGSDIQGTTGSTYTLSDDDEGKTIQVRVTFTDDAGNPEALTSAPTDAVQPPPNSPTITGTVRVGETLTADTSEIRDEDGMENAATRRP